MVETRRAYPGALTPRGATTYTSYPTKSLGYEASDPDRGDPSDPDPDPISRPTYHGSGAVAFSTKGEYGVRLMVQLARHYGSGPVSLAGVAAEEDLPRAYLEQLVVSLREAGLVDQHPWRARRLRAGRVRPRPSPWARSCARWRAPSPR